MKLIADDHWLVTGLRSGGYPNRSQKRLYDYSLFITITLTNVEIAGILSS
jgi:hypothetical protein